jgi:2',3'-cyclic-nucleotide 2'-phosphodiesterase (5'-nucleotidase family)
MTVLFVLFSQTLSAEPTHITILHFNDIHGHIEANCTAKKCEGGAARMATVIKGIKAENDATGAKTLVLFGGDAFSGTPVSSEFKGEAEFKVLDALGILAMVPGNHEFDFSLPVLKERIAEAKFPVLAANVKYKKSKKTITTPALTKVFDPTGASLYIIGLVSRNTPQMTNPKNVVGLVFEDPVKTAKYYLKQSETLEKQVPVLQIGLTHMGVESDINLAEKTKGFDVIVGGHDHVRPNQYCRTVKKVPICQTPLNGEYLGRLDFEMDGRKIKYLGSKLIELTQDIKEDQQIASLVAGYSKSISAKYDKPIGVAKTNFSRNQGQENPMGDLVTDAMRSVANTDIAIINTSGIRSTIKKGPVTYRIVAEVLPFEDYLMTTTLTGREIEETLNSSIRKGGGAFLQVSGLSFKIKEKKAADILVGGKPTNPESSYGVAVAEFIANGGEGYKVFRSKRSESTGMLLREALSKYLEEKKTIAAGPLDRITE